MIGSLAFVCLLGVGLAADASANPQLTCFEFSGKEMWAPARIVLYTSDAETAKTAADAALARMHQLNDIFSDYDPESETRRLCETAGQGKEVHVSEELWKVLVAADAIAERSDGAFDVTVGPIVLLWRQARRTGQLPPPDAISEALNRVGHSLIRFYPERRSVELVKPGMQLDFGGIAKGYAVDEALAVLHRHGITRAMVVLGGEIAVGDPPPDKLGWAIGVAPLDLDGPPKHRLWLSGVTVSTSGDAWQHVEIDGRRYSHVVDPRTGIGLTDHSSVTIIAPNGLTAEGMAKVVSVLGPEKGMKIVDQTPDTAALIVRASDGKRETCKSSRWEQIAGK